jgi:hypothetical protein
MLAWNQIHRRHEGHMDAIEIMEITVAIGPGYVGIADIKHHQYANVLWGIIKDITNITFIKAILNRYHSRQDIMKDFFDIINSS